MEEKSNNIRRIPVGEFLKLRKISFLVYMYLQQISYWNSEQQEDHRYIPVESCNKSKTARETGLSRPTVIKVMDELLKEGLVEYKKVNDNYYYILPNIGDYYVLCGFTIGQLRAMFNHLSEPLIRVILFHKSFAIYAKRKGEEEYHVPISYILESIGYSTKSKQVVIECNEVLEGMGVLNIRKVQKFDDEGSAYYTNMYKWTGAL